ncbi:hypothetical protein EDC18_101504 [Natranaerovirga pectinivora]|uniref:Uncharacterized protein n=1 Tax=Natranaerovirga pectinivora TaxID=682400 RepID=A0A4R3MV67_9FIRM|nr:hypothetical protein [Natranaerovirga pectinivora]TCT17206.1 hypothetical protein EDC18_101504 [Natranaerovirga pectinivora]
MKKLFCIITVCLSLCIGCQRATSGDAGNINLENKPLEVESTNSVNNKVLGKGIVQMPDLSEYTLELQMYNGKYYYDESPGAFQGDNWVGDCKLVLSKDNVMISEFNLTDWNEEMRFQTEFDILTYDYNDDGQYEFLIGQYLSSNIYEYRLYRIKENLEIVNLQNVDYLNISGGGRYSNLLGITETGDIYYKYYDNSRMEYITKMLLFENGTVTKIPL